MLHAGVVAGCPEQLVTRPSLRPADAHCGEGVPSPSPRLRELVKIGPPAIQARMPIVEYSVWVILHTCFPLPSDSSGRRVVRLAMLGTRGLPSCCFDRAPGVSSRPSGCWVRPALRKPALVGNRTTLDRSRSASLSGLAAVWR
jgi:hypothetical protein